MRDASLIEIAGTSPAMTIELKLQPS